MSKKLSPQEKKKNNIKRILALLDKPRTISQLARLIPLSRDTVVKHIAVLEALGELEKWQWGNVQVYCKREQK